MAAKVSQEFTTNIDGRDVVLFFRRPNQTQLFEIDLTYRKMFSEAVRNNVMTEAEARKLFKKSNAWVKEDDDRVNAIALDIAQRQRILEGYKDKPKQEVLEAINKIVGLRNELMELIGQRTSMFSQTAEGIANDQRIHKLIELCLIQKETDDPYFESFEDYRDFAATDPDALSTMYKYAWLFEYNTKENMEDEFPEMKILKELAELETKEAEVVPETKSADSPASGTAE